MYVFPVLADPECMIPGGLRQKIRLQPIRENRIILPVFMKFWIRP